MCNTDSDNIERPEDPPAGSLSNSMGPQNNFGVIIVKLLFKVGKAQCVLNCLKLLYIHVCSKVK